ncbi:hypothetical protein BC829DRAFT_442431 [Chytridium lagenaria]|nr:hypothetical protein BC829DRAFT_442431 [Chytridium lagenaria]
MEVEFACPGELRQVVVHVVKAMDKDLGEDGEECGTARGNIHAAEDVVENYGAESKEKVVEGMCLEELGVVAGGTLDGDKPFDVLTMLLKQLSSSVEVGYAPAEHSNVVDGH